MESFEVKAHWGRLLRTRCETLSLVVGLSCLKLPAFEGVLRLQGNKEKSDSSLIQELEFLTF